jgi:predicted lipoprotein with Yx(FWY)xxD motif
MTRTGPFTLRAGIALVPLIALAAAGCGGGSSGSAASPSAPKATNQTGPTVDVSTNRLGEVLVDSKGRTLYLFKKDKGKRSTCSGPCASAWPPLRAGGKLTAAGDAKTSRISTTPRSDGGPQITYRGHPLYLYEGDDKPGDANGQGLNSWGGRWFALSPAGKQLTHGSPPKGAGTGY